MLEAGVFAAVLLGACAAHAADGRSLSVGLQTGPTLWDGALSNYRWDRGPRIGWGAEALARSGRFAAGVLLFSTATRQQVDPSGGAASPEVRSIRYEAVGRGRLLTVMGSDLAATAGVGRMHLGYHPDRIAIDTGTGSPIEVEFRPIDEWIGGAGLSLERPLASRLSATLALEHRWFGLDTAHRNGSVIETGRETFGEWSARLGGSWIFHGR